MRVDLNALLEPATTVVLTQERQRGVVGTHSALPDLAAIIANNSLSLTATITTTDKILDCWKHLAAADGKTEST